MDSLLERNPQYEFPRSTRRAPTSSLDFSELGSVTAPSSVGRDRSVELTDDDVLVLSELARTLLAQLMTDYEAHASAHIDPKRWKSIKRREQLTVYRERSSARSSRDSDAAPSTAPSSSTPDDTTAAATPAAPSRTVPRVMLTGSLPGRVDDVLYGLTSASARAMKFRSAYAQDATVVDADVLATLAGPSVDEPFRFLGLKWLLLQHRGAGAPFAKMRDVVYLEATGTTALATGDVVAYHIVHSVHLAARSTIGRADPSVVRAATSMGHLFCQRPTTASSSSGSNNSTTDTLDVFMRGYYDPRGDMLQFVALNVAAEQLLQTATRSVECAQLKKLSFAAHESTRQRRGTAVASSRLEPRSTAGGSASLLRDMAAAARDVDRDAIANSSASVCAVCARRVGNVLQRSSAACTICTRMVCARCIVSKKLSFTRDDDDGDDTGACGNDDDDSVDWRSSSRSSRRVRANSTATAATMSVRSALSSVTSASRVQREICQKAMRFCVPCLLRAHAQCATHVAVEELLEQQARAHARAAAVACSSSSSAYGGASGQAPTPRQVLAMAAHARMRQSARVDSVHFPHKLQQQQQQPASQQQSTSQPQAGPSNSTSTSRTTTTTTRVGKTPRAKAFSTASTASSTTSSVVLYEEPSVGSDGA